MSNAMFSIAPETDVEAGGDFLGGGGVVFDTDIYEGKIKLAYLRKSASTNSQALHLDIVINGQDFRTDLWVMNKEGKYYSERDGKKRELGGYTHANELCLMTINKPLAALIGEDKVIPLYNFEARKEEPTNVKVAVELIGKDVSLAILKQIVDKTKKNDATGQYDPTGEKREENTVEKFFHVPSNRTVTEAKNGITTPDFHTKWRDRNKGQVRDRSTGAAAGQAGRPGVPGQAPQASGMFGGGAPAPAPASGGGSMFS